MHTTLKEKGFEIIRGVIAPDQRAEAVAALGDVHHACRRGILVIPEVARLARSHQLRALMSVRLGAPAFPVRAIYFNKSCDSNWLVPWHQDVSIAVKARAEVPGYGPWSVKEGVPHVQPPVEILEQMLTIRLHLDDCDEENGALQVIPSSHRYGRLGTRQIGVLREKEPATCCRARAGDALLMHPLILHASGHSRSDRHRRVLHVEYAACRLPQPLKWFEEP
jgi:hypothetical protein